MIFSSITKAFAGHLANERDRLIGEKMELHEKLDKSEEKYRRLLVFVSTQKELIEKLLDQWRAIE